MSDTAGKKEAPREIDYAKWDFSWYTRTCPQLVAHFNVPPERFTTPAEKGLIKKEGDARNHSRDAKKFLSSMGMQYNHHAEDNIEHFKGDHAVRIRGVGNITKFARWLCAHNEGGRNNALLALIPASLGGEITKAAEAPEEKPAAAPPEQPAAPETKKPEQLGFTSDTSWAVPPILRGGGSARGGSGGRGRGGRH